MIESRVYEILELYYKERNNIKIPLEYYVLPFKKNKYIIYFPLKGMLSLVNKKFIENIGKNDYIVNGLFETVSKNTSVKIHELELRNDLIMIELTKDCNLKCVYCYGNGGENPEYLDWETAKTGIDWALKRCRSKSFKITFHGGGEPLLAFPIMKKCCEYAKKKCKERNIKFETSATTNGTLITEDIAKWFKKIGMHIAVSFDGIPKIHNKQRPFKDGSGTYDTVKNAINILSKHNVWYGISSTVTDKSAYNICDNAKHLKNLPIKSWSMSFVMECGRCYKTCTKKPKYKIFLKNIENAKIICDKYGIPMAITKKMGFARSENEIFTNNCYASGEHIVITAGGYISSCGTITNEKDPATKEFFYGQIKNGKVNIDKNKLNYLKNRTVNNMPQCKDCFAKYFCRGTCLAESAREGGTVYHTFKEECQRNKKQSYEFLKNHFK